MFTTYQRDSESGLDYAMARYYDSTVARFCSADPLGGQLDDPQTWNRYAYARNDPIDLTDPSGQGFLTWFFDALAILADIFIPGSAAEAAAQWGIDLPALQVTSTIAAAEQTGKATQPQGQQQPPTSTQQSAKPPSLLCQPQLWDAMKIAYNSSVTRNAASQAKTAKSMTEGGFPVYNNSQGGIRIGDGPAGTSLENQIKYGPAGGWDPNPSGGASAVFHVHPIGSGLPSSPNNTAGQGSGDTGYAAARNVDNYVISYEGLSVARATGPIVPPKKGWDPWVIKGNGIDDWLTKLKKQCGTQ